jgi:hypothetical protein
MAPSDEENKDGQDDDRNIKAWMNLSRLARYKIMTAYDEAGSDGGDEDRGRLMRVHRWAATENRDEQRMEIDATNSDEVNEDETMIDEDVSSIDTMNGWNALKEMLEQGSSGDDFLDDNESIASNLMIKEQSNRGEDRTDVIEECEEIEEEEDDNDGDELGKGRGGRVWPNGGEDQQSAKADEKADKEEKEEKYLYRRALRIASWNVGNGYREEPIVELMVGKEINFLANQEPIMPNGTSEDRLKWIKHNRKYTQEHDIEPTIMQHQIVHVDQKRLGFARIDAAKQAHQGRVMTGRFWTRENKTMHVIACYNVTRGDPNDVYKSSGKTRKKLTEEVQATIIKEIETAMKDPNDYVVLLGDTQEK